MCSLRLQGSEVGVACFKLFCCFILFNLVYRYLIYLVLYFDCGCLCIVGLSLFCCCFLNSFQVSAGFLLLDFFKIVFRCFCVEVFPFKAKKCIQVVVNRFQSVEQRFRLLQVVQCVLRFFLEKEKKSWLRLL